MADILFLGGTVYSQQDPFATALLVSGDTVAWLGSDDAARAVAPAGARVIELDGALVAPAFVDAAMHLGALARELAPGDAAEGARAALREAAAQGVACVHVVDDAGTAPVDAPDLPLWVACDASCPPRAVDPDLGDARVVQSLLAERGVAVLSRGAAARAPLAAASAAGVPLALGSGPPPGAGGGGLASHLDPWATIAVAVLGPASGDSPSGSRITMRAAFTAHTRGGWRAGPAARATGQGRLAVGAPATLAVWEVAELGVQAPDERVAAWSTDPRSGTPQLPRLPRDAAAGGLPRCLFTLRDGALLHGSGFLGN